MKKNWLAPGYYPDFRCKADHCRNSCCRMWRIPVSREEYNRLITMECSESLNECIQNAFVVPEMADDSSFRYVSFNWLGDCRIMKDGLCQIQKEKGEEYLPKICRLYPRSFKCVNGTNIVSCSTACESVVEMIYETDCLSIVQVNTTGEAQFNYTVEKEDAKQIKQIQDIVRNRDISLAGSIEKICRLINKSEFEKDYNADIDYVRNALDLLGKISSNNYYLKDLYEKLSLRYSDNSLYYDDCKVFEDKYPDWMNFFERLINNSMIYKLFPFVDKRFEKTEAYKGLCCTYGLLRLVCAGAVYNSDHYDDLIDAISYLFHAIEHTAFYYNASIMVDNAAVMLKL